MVLLLLAVVWSAVLAPPLLRRGAESRRADSIGDFRKQLGVLQRTGPKVIAPAHRRVEHRPAPAAPARAAVTRPTRPAPPMPGSRSKTLKRRRDVLVGLVGSTGLTLVVGVVPGMHLVLAVAGVLAALLVAYVAVLVRMRNAAAERDMKLRFLPGTAGADGAVLLRRSAN